MAKKDWSREAETKEAISAIDEACKDFWDSFEKKQIKCEHKNIFFGSGAFFIICNDCQQHWKAVKKMGSDEPDYNETTKDLTGKKAK